jgi:predicted nucleic acid-binding Zn ribbon protein
MPDDEIHEIDEIEEAAELPATVAQPAAAEPPAADPDAAAAAALRRATRSTAPAKPRRRQPGATFSNDRDPAPLGDAVERFIRDQGWQDESAVAVLMSSWGSIVGHDVAEHVQPVGFTGGELTLQASSTTWATQVRLLLPDLQRAVDDSVGKGVVTRIKVLGPQGPTWTAGPRRVKGRGPRDTYG